MNCLFVRLAVARGMVSMGLLTALAFGLCAYSHAAAPPPEWTPHQKMERDLQEAKHFVSKGNIADHLINSLRGYLLFIFL